MSASKSGRRPPHRDRQPRRQEHRKRPSRRSRLFLERLEDRLAPAVIQWSGGPTGLGTVWNDPANWVGNRLPTAIDDVQIGTQFAGITISDSVDTTVRSIASAAGLKVQGGHFSIFDDTGSAPASHIDNTLTVKDGTFDVITPVTVQDLSFVSGEIGGRGTLTLTGSKSSWNGGDVTDPGTWHIARGATLAIVVGGGAVFTGDKQLLNDGTVNLSGTGALASSKSLGVTNHGTFEILGPVGLTGAGSFANTGTLRKSGIGTSGIDLPVANDGKVAVVGGTLSLHAAADSSGAFQVDPGCGLEFAPNGTETLAASSSVSGAGNVTFLPGTVSLNGAYTVTGLTLLDGGRADFNTDVTIPSMEIRGFFIPFQSPAPGVLGGTGTVTVTGTLTWTNGAMTGPGTTRIAAGAQLNAGDATGKVLSGGRRLVNDGTITLSGGGSLSRQGDGTLTNNGLLVLHGDTGGLAGGGALANLGTLRKDAAGTGTTGIDWAVSNDGKVEVLGGTLSLGGTATSSGAFQVAGGCGLEFANGQTLAPSSSVSGAGRVTFSSGTVTVNGGYTVTGLTVLAGGRADFNTNLTIPALDFRLGILGGTGTVTLTGTPSWTGGDMQGSGTTHIPAGVTLVVGGAATKSLHGTRALVNDGTISLEGAGKLDSNFVPGIVQVTNNGLFLIRGDIPGLTGGGALANAGTLRKDPAGTGTCVIDWDLNNSGKVEVLGGTVLLRGNGAATSSGAFQVAAGCGLEFALGGSQTLTASSSISGAGHVTISSGTLIVNGGYTVTGLTLLDAGRADFNTNVSIPALEIHGFFIPGQGFSNGTLGGAGTVTVTGTLKWTGGNMAGTGTTHIASGAELKVSDVNNKNLSDGRGLINDGTITLAGSGAVTRQGAGTLANNGLFEIQADAGGLTGGVLVNAGTLRKTAAGTSAINGDLDNSGTVEVLGGTLVVGGSLTNYSASTKTLTGGTYVLRGGTIQFPNADIQTNAATLILDGPAARIVDQSGADALAHLASNAAGRFTIENGRNFTTAGAFSNAGDLTIGAGSSFTADRSFTQAANALLTIGIGGAPASGQVGALKTSGPATLDGTLRVSLENGFGPSIGQSFQVLNFAGHGGAFATTEGLRVHGVPVFQALLNPTDLTLKAQVSVADLAADSITVPATGVLGENVTIGYTVRNLSASVPAGGSWFDSLYLSAGTTLDAKALLIGRVQHVGDVAPLGSYSGTLTAALPGAVEGPYHVILVVDSRGLVPDVNRANNILASTDTILAGLQALTLGQKISGTIADGQDRYFRLDVPAGTDVQFTGNLAAAGQAQLFARRGALPDRTHFDQAADSFGVSQQTLLLSRAGGTYYVLLHGLPAAAGGQPFDLIAETGVFRATAAFPAVGSNAGSATTEIFGAGFSSATVAELVSGTGSRPARSVVFRDGLPLFVTFDLTGMAPGQYEIRLQDGNRQATAPSFFTVTTGNPGRLDVFLHSPPAISIRHPSGSLNVEYVNVGQTDLPVESLELKADGAALFLVHADNSGQTRSLDPTTVDFATTQTHGLAGVLPPEGNDRILLNFQIPDPTHPPPAVGFSLKRAPAAPLDLATLKNTLRPASVPADAWDVIFANLAAMIGNTTQSFQAALDDAARYLSQLGQGTNDPNLLSAFLLQQADNAYPGGALAADIDAAAPAVGLPLSLSRIYLQPISRRFQLGLFGRGWTTPYDLTLSADARGLVVEGPGGTRSFQPDGPASLQAHGLFGDPGVLVGVQTDPFGHLTGPATLHETDGTEYRFEADGKLHQIRDPNGNTITLNYSDGRLTSLVHSDGDRFQLDYNAQGRVSKLTDQAGRATAYTYDADGQHLLQVAGPFGTVVYTYETGTGVAREHALKAITYRDGSHTFYSYDAQGRLIHAEQDGGAEPATIAYGEGGTVTVTDATGASFTVRFNAFGQPSQDSAPLGRLVAHDFDANQNPVQDRLPGGRAMQYQFNEQGLPTGATDPTGHGIAQTFAPSQFLTLGDGSQLPSTQRQRSLTDQLGVVTRFDYDPQGNLLTLTYADGITEQFAYDTAGNVTQYRNRSGQMLSFTYNARGQLVRREHADGSHEDFTYDDRGNLLTAADARGTTTYEYNAADRLTRVTYPNGRFLVYTYDAGQRLRIGAKTTQAA